MRNLVLVGWALAALASSAAAALVVRALSPATPIDRALPFLAFVAVFLAALARSPRVALAAPLLVVVAIVFGDAPTRLLAYGLVMACAFGATMLSTDSILIIVAGVFVLRWIPFSEVEVGRELLVLAGSLALAFALRPRRSLTLAAVLAVALVVPTHPGKPLLIPFALALASLVPLVAVLAALALLAFAFFARASLVALCVASALALLAPRLARSPLAVPLLAVGFVSLGCFAWSGVVARGSFPVPLQPSAAEAAAATQKQVIGRALVANESIDLDVPADARHVVVIASGANMASMAPGTLVGRIDGVDRRGRAVGRDVRIGDVADFGFMRREHFFKSRNPRPHDPSWDFRGYGWSGFLYGAGRVVLDAPDGFASLRVTGAPSLKSPASLQVESIETRAR